MKTISAKPRKHIKNSLLVIALHGVGLAILLVGIVGNSTTSTTAQSNASIIEANPLTAGRAASNSTSTIIATTAQITIKANTLALIWVGQADGRLGASILTDPNRTWVQVISSYPGLRRLTMYRSMEPVDTTGAITIDPLPSEITWSATWSVVEYANVDTSGIHGSGALAQYAARNYADAGGGLALSGSVTLAGTNETSSASVGGFIMNWGARPLFAGSGYALTGNSACYILCLQSEFRSDFTSLVNMSWSSLAHWIAIAAELKAADSSGAVCGNGFLEGLEQCDDSNTISCDSCNSLCRNEVLQTSYQDLDIDTYGNILVSQSSYCPFGGYVSNNVDCDDSLITGPLANPGFSEGIGAANCSDGIDNDCDGTIDAADSGCTVSAISYVVGSLTLSCNSICANVAKTCNLTETNADTNILPSCSLSGQDVKRFSDNACGNVKDGCATVRSISGERSCACQ